MEIILNKTPKNVKIIEGFPGFGLVGTITTEYLVKELSAELIGHIRIGSGQPMVAVHGGKIVRPIGLYYVKKNNLLIIHVMNPVVGKEWDLSKIVLELAKKLSAKELISIEGVASNAVKGTPTAFYYTTSPTIAKKFEAAKVVQMKDGVVMGVTASLLLDATTIPFSAIFTETPSNLPDSKAAAKAIEVLDKYLGMKIDYKPLLKQAKLVEEKIKQLIQQTQDVSSEQKKKQLSYVG